MVQADVHRRVNHSGVPSVVCAPQEEGPTPVVCAPQEEGPTPVVCTPQEESPTPVIRIGNVMRNIHTRSLQ